MGTREEGFLRRVGLGGQGPRARPLVKRGVDEARKAHVRRMRERMGRGRDLPPDSRRLAL
jgi:hypothetical protein